MRAEFESLGKQVAAPPPAGKRTKSGMKHTPKTLVNLEQPGTGGLHVEPELSDTVKEWFSRPVAHMGISRSPSAVQKRNAGLRKKGAFLEVVVWKLSTFDQPEMSCTCRTLTHAPRAVRRGSTSAIHRL